MPSAHYKGRVAVLDSVSLRRTAQPPTTISDVGTNRGDWLCPALFGLVLLDSLVTYFQTNIVHVHFPANALVPGALLLVMLRTGPARFVPPPATIFGLSLLFLAFLSGVLFTDLYKWPHLLTIIGLFVSFTIGYAIGHSQKSIGPFFNVLLAIGLLYGAVCVIALLQIAPKYFPVQNSIGWHGNVLIVRPEITTNQNFQVFYLFFLPVFFLLPLRAAKAALLIIASVTAAYILVRLQTRSGVMVFAGAIAFAWATPLLYKRLGRIKLIVLPLIFCIFAAARFRWIMGVAQQLIFRFTDKGSYNTFQGRVYSAQYLFDHLFDTNYWLPRGNTEFVGLTGDVPHFNPTAMYMEGGLLGLVAWTMLIFVPLFLLTKRYFQRDLDQMSLVIFGCGAMMLAAQFTLNAPLHDHVWLWGGAVIGCLNRRYQWEPSR